MNTLIVNAAIDAAVPTSSPNSDVIYSQNISQVSMHAILSGSTTPNVTVAFYMSNEETPINYIAITSGSVTFSDNGQKMLRIDVAARWLVVVASDGGGTSGGELTVHVFGNGPN